MVAYTYNFRIGNQDRNKVNENNKKTDMELAKKRRVVEEHQELRRALKEDPFYCNKEEL